MRKISFFNRRQQIDQDAREVRIIKEMLFEEEEDKGDRERKFRWKHLDNVNLNEFAASGDGDDAAGHESDDDNEAEWRRLRYEREQTLLNQQIAPSEPQDDVRLCLWLKYSRLFQNVCLSF